MHHYWYINYTLIFFNNNKEALQKVPGKRAASEASTPLWVLSVNLQLIPPPSPRGPGPGRVPTRAKRVLINSEPYWQLCGLLQAFAAWKTFSNEKSPLFYLLHVKLKKSPHVHWGLASNIRVCSEGKGIKKGANVVLGE